MSVRQIKRALLSVSCKTGIVEFAQALHDMDIQLLSTGGTASLLKQNNIPVTDVSDYTGFPEIMGGRVKTLHPKIHGALLGRPGIDDDVMSEHDIVAIDMVVVNLYPFAETIANPQCTLDDAIENIDIGGPTMLRAAAKNYRTVSVIVNPEKYNTVLAELRDNPEHHISLETRFELAKQAFAHTAKYDASISNYLNTIDDNSQSTFSQVYQTDYVKIADLRYGENPHQQAAFYGAHSSETGNIANAQQLQGKALSYNNIADTDAALECVKEFNETPACVIVKHANPCGVAIADNQLTAYERAFATDPTSSFGGIIAFNQTLEAQTAEAIIAKQFVEVIIAPEVSEAALTICSSKPNVRVLSCGQWPSQAPASYDYKKVAGGLLIQDRDVHQLDPTQLQTVSQRAPNEQELQDLLFAWSVAKFVKSNAIVYCKDQATVGIGAGQMSRVYSARIAGIKAEDEGLTVAGAVMASDAFFPFRDGIDAAAACGITAIIQPGGSIRDEEVIAAANEAGIAMVFTGVRHFRH